MRTESLTDSQNNNISSNCGYLGKVTEPLQRYVSTLFCMPPSIVATSEKPVRKKCPIRATKSSTTAIDDDARIAGISLQLTTGVNYHAQLFAAGCTRPIAT